MSKKRHLGPGRIIKAFPKEFVVSTVDGHLRVIDYEMPEVNTQEQKSFLKEGARFDLL